ncbi:MAG: zinc ribbon domain-containing protein [Chloroflexi bacterium]|nr:zinc ribbon domain-containing protein [Chloroflexota bacterium]
MILLGSILLVLAVLLVVTYPILRPKPVPEAADDSGQRDLIARRDTLYSALAELQMDYEMGNLSPADHKQLEERYKEKAMSVLREMDIVAEEGDLDTAIERQVARLRRSRRGAPHKREEDAEQDIEQEVLRLRQRPATTRALVPCPHCGHEIAAAARFCPQCGVATSQKCPRCGVAVDAEARFCSQCGTSLKQEKS